MSDDLLKKLSKDVEKIRDDQVELIKQSAVHNHLLKEHEARSLALQEQVKIAKSEIDAKIKPVEDHVKFVNSIAKLGTIGAGVGSFLYYAIKLLRELTL